MRACATIRVYKQVRHSNAVMLTNSLATIKDHSSTVNSIHMCSGAYVYTLHCEESMRYPLDNKDWFWTLLTWAIVIWLVYTVFIE